MVIRFIRIITETVPQLKRNWWLDWRKDIDETCTQALEPGAVMALQVWHTAGDTSSELTWYTKRAALAAIYSASELYILTGVPSTCTRRTLPCSIFWHISASRWQGLAPSFDKKRPSHT